jgi:hypothetical protein
MRLLKSVKCIPDYYVHPLSTVARNGPVAETDPLQMVDLRSCYLFLRRHKIGKNITKFSEGTTFPYHKKFIPLSVTPHSLITEKRITPPMGPVNKK